MEYIFLAFVLLFFLVFLYVFIGSRFLYSAQLAYHYIFEHRLYNHFRAAQKQIKEHGPLSFLPLTYWVNSDSYHKYQDVYKDKYHLIDISSNPTLYLGDKLVLTNFSALLIKQLIKESNISTKNVLLLNLIEKRCDMLGYLDFMEKYFGPDWNTKEIKYKDFLKSFVEKDEQVVYIKSEK